MKKTLSALVLAAIVTVSFSVTNAAAQNDGYQADDMLVLGAGWYDPIDADDQAASAHIEYHPDWRAFSYVAPFAGAMVTSDGGLYGFGGLGLDIPTPMEQLRLFPSLAAGGYADGSGKDLGYGLQFRSGVELHYYPDFLENGGRFGLGFHHISNASLGNHNPGVEIVSFTYGHPLSFGQ